MCLSKLLQRTVCQTACSVRNVSCSPAAKLVGPAPHPYSHHVVSGGAISWPSAGHHGLFMSWSIIWPTTSFIRSSIESTRQSSPKPLIRLTVHLAWGDAEAPRPVDQTCRLDLAIRPGDQTLSWSVLPRKMSLSRAAFPLAAVSELLGAAAGRGAVAGAALLLE